MREVIVIGFKGKYLDWLTDDGLLRVFGWAREGLTDEQIAHNMGVAYSTFRAWVDKYPALSASLKKGKEPVDIEVENALLKRARGFTYEETTTDVEQIPTSKTDEDGNPIIREIVHTKTVTKIALPDVTAQIFWLKNRRPDRWRDKQDVAVNAEPVRIVIDV